MKNLLLFIAVISLVASCRSSRNISRAVARKDSTAKITVPVAAKTDTQRLIQTALEGIEKNRFDFRTFTAKVGIDYKGTDGKEHDVNANIKIYKDSAIWISVNAILGIEAMRLLVTKDSLKFLVKLDQKTYTARSISYLQEITSLPLNLYTLQDLIIGHPVFLDSNIIRYNRNNGIISLLSLGSLFKNLLTINENNNTLLQSKLDDTNPARNRTADLTYSEYETKKGVLFSTKRQIVVSEKGRLDVKLEFKNYNFNEEVSFPFSVPKNYTSN